MKKAGAITNIILMIAVAILFFLHFDSEKQEIQKEEAKSEETSESKVEILNPDSLHTIPAVRGMYYIDQDSLSLKSVKLKNLIERNQTKIQGLENTYQKAMSDFQQYDSQMAIKAQTADVFQRGQIESEYKRKAYDLSKLEQETQQKLLNIQTVFSKTLKKLIVDGIDAVNTKNQFTYVLMSSTTIDIVLPVDKSLNITNQVAAAIDAK